MHVNLRNLLLPFSHWNFRPTRKNNTDVSRRQPSSAHIQSEVHEPSNSGNKRGGFRARGPRLTHFSGFLLSLVRLETDMALSLALRLPLQDFSFLAENSGQQLLSWMLIMELVRSTVDSGWWKWERIVFGINAEPLAPKLVRLPSLLLIEIHIPCSALTSTDYPVQFPSSRGQNLPYTFLH